jgi:AraC family transcriptional regulator, transcriptional activator of pobA
MSAPPTLLSALPAHQPLAVRRLARCAPSTHPGRDVVHDHAGLAVYLSGTTRMWMRADYTLVRGDLLLIPEGMPHCPAASSGGEAATLALCTGCMQGAWGGSLREAFDGVRRGEVAVRRLSEPGLVEVERILAALAEELEERRPHRALMVDGLMSQLSAQVARAAPAGVRAAAEGCPSVVADALAYIERNATRSISLADVARSVGRSPAHLATTVKRHTGRTVVAWITHGRMAVARQLLLSTEEGVEAVAEAVGFASPSHFHRTFRRLHGVPPGSWRQAHRKPP